MEATNHRDASKYVEQYKPLKYAESANKTWWVSHTNLS